MTKDDKKEPKTMLPVSTSRIPSLKPPTSAARDEFLAGVRQRYGADSIVEMNDAIAGRKHQVIPSGSFLLDQALGGGWPFGRIIEVFGPEGGGKTTTALHAVASMQKYGGTCAFIDVEHALSPEYAKAIGVDVNRLEVSQPKSGEQAMNLFKEYATSGLYNLVVVDSVAALVTQAELDGEIGDVKVGAVARLLSGALKQLVAAVDSGSDSPCMGLLINQIRMKIGGYGNPEETTGGKALKYYSSVRVEVRAGEKVGDKERPTGQKTRIKVVKNKMAPPFRNCELDLVYGKGFWATGELVDLALEYGIIKKSGAWYYLSETERLAQGRENAALALEARPDVLARIEAEVREKL